MTITNEILEGFLYCKTKGYLKLTGEVGTKSDYEAMIEADSRASRALTIAGIVARHGETVVPRATAVTAAALAAGAPLLVDAILEDDGVSIHFDGLGGCPRISRASTLSTFLACSDQLIRAQREPRRIRLP